MRSSFNASNVTATVWATWCSVRSSRITTQVKQTGFCRRTIHSVKSAASLLVAHRPRRPETRPFIEPLNSMLPGPNKHVPANPRTLVHRVHSGALAAACQVRAHPGYTKCDAAHLLRGTEGNCGAYGCGRRAPAQNDTMAGSLWSVRFTTDLGAHF